MCLRGRRLGWLPCRDLALLDQLESFCPGQRRPSFLSGQAIDISVYLHLLDAKSWRRVASFALQDGKFPAQFAFKLASKSLLNLKASSQILLSKHADFKPTFQCVPIVMIFQRAKQHTLWSAGCDPIHFMLLDCTSTYVPTLGASMYKRIGMFALYKNQTDSSLTTNTIHSIRTCFLARSTAQAFLILRSINH